MADILHRIGAKAPVDDVYDALTTIDGLAGWWTSDTDGDAAVDGVIRFRFDIGNAEPDGFDMRVLEAQSGKLVLWEVVAGPEEWVGTQVRWELVQEEEFAIVMFAHEGWREPVPFMNHCSTKWASFLLSLKEYVETGRGRPAPHDLTISNWH